MKEGESMPQIEATPKKSAVRRWAFSAYEWVSTLIVSLLVLVVLFTFVFRVVRVDGDSMDKTLQSGDQLLLMTNVTEYQRGDIVVVDRYTVEPLVKRIIAVGGDTIKIDTNGFVYLNGSLLGEPYAAAFTPQKDCDETVVVPEGHVFLMGDNRLVSKDSRMDEIGMVLEKDIVGKAIFRIGPFSSFGGIYYNLEQSYLGSK